MGIRLGADKAEGPMSIGNLASYSGYLTGKTNLNIQAQTNIGVTCQGGTAGCTSELQNILVQRMACHQVEH